MDDLCEVTITPPDAEWLADFVRILVQERLCASGHVDSTIRSIYRWQGEIFDKTEARATLHTRLACVDEIIRRTDQLHPYEVPCVVAVPFVAGPAYLDWIEADDLTNRDHSVGRKPQAHREHHECGGQHGLASLTARRARTTGRRTAA